MNKIHLLSAIILLIGVNIITLLLERSDGIGIELGFDPGLEISMQGHLLRNIYEPYVICNKNDRWD